MDFNYLIQYLQEKFWGESKSSEPGFQENLAELPEPVLEAIILGLDNYWDIINLCTSSKRLVQLCTNNVDILNHINESIFAPKAFGGKEPNFNYLVFDRRPGVMLTDILESIIKTVLSKNLNKGQKQMVENNLRHIKKNYPLLWNKLSYELRNSDPTMAMVPWGQPVQTFDQVVKQIQRLDEMLINNEEWIDREAKKGNFQAQPQPRYGKEESSMLYPWNEEVVKYMEKL